MRPVAVQANHTFTPPKGWLRFLASEVALYQKHLSFLHFTKNEIQFMARGAHRGMVQSVE